MISMNFSNTKKIFVVIIVVALMVSVFSGCGNNSSVNGKSKIKTRILTDGFWLAAEEINHDDNVDYEYGNDYGFVFKKDSDGEFDGTVLTCAQYLWKYSVTDDDTIEIYRFDGDYTQYILMFYGTYSKEDDALNLSFTEEAEDYYDTMDSNSTVRMSHFPDSEYHNKLYKKLLFETWSTVNYKSVEPPQGGFENKKDYSNFRNGLYDIDPTVEVYKFYYNYKDFDLSKGNAKASYYKEESDSWVYKAQTYRLTDGINEIEITPYEDYKTYVYSYDREFTELVLSNWEEDKVIYRMTNFTD